MNLNSLPAFNATMNALAFCCLLASLWAIKVKKNERLHRNLIFMALGLSTIFLTSYLYYHYHVGHTVFPYQGLIRTIYFLILVPHIILAAGMVPLIVMSVYFALTKQVDRHKKIARITMPIWLYVSVTGVIIYWMLYKL